MVDEAGVIEGLILDAVFEKVVGEEELVEE